MVIDERGAIPLSVAATRPVLKWGLPLEIWVLLFALTCETIIWTDSLVYASVWVGAGYAFRWFIKRDYNAPRVWVLWLKTKGISLDAHLYGAVSPAPYPLRVKNRAR
jgi:type IV secretory pathway VirB3-like protein